MLEQKQVSDKKSGIKFKKNIKTCSNTSINRKLTTYVVRTIMNGSVRRGVAYYFEIKKTSKLAQTNHLIGNSPPMLLEQKWVSKKRSGILLF